MLTKEKCVKALDKIVQEFGCDPAYYGLNMEHTTLLALIDEHFELLEKYRDLQDENARLSFDKIVNNIEDMNYKLSLDNPPLQLEDIHVGMWLWDNVDKMYTQVVGYYTETCLICSLGLKREYEPNRFYLKEVV